MPKSETPKNGETPVLPPELAHVRAGLEYISGILATNWLKNSPPFNRGIGKRVVFRYASAMVELRWIFTGESIVFDDGELGQERILDGWHRLSAIAQSGVGGWFVVVRGVPKGAFHYIDHGRGRVFRDTLTVLENPNPSVVSAAVSYLTNWRKVGRFTTHGLEDHEKWQTYEQYASRLNELQENYSKRSPLRGVAPGLLVAVHLVLSEISDEGADEFMDQILHGDDLDEGHPVSQFRAYVRKQEAVEPKIPNLNTRYGAGLTKAWNLVRDDERIAKFVVGTTTPKPH